MCKKPLTEVVDGPGLVLGEEAHIIGARENGPRGRDGDRDDIDGYDNLILLCADDHKRIDSEPDDYTADWLRAKKAEHEAWARDKLSEQPLRIVVAKDEASIPMMPVLTGDAVWELAAGAAMFDFRPPLSDDDRAASDAADEFLTNARDTAEIYGAIQDSGFGAVREAKRSLHEMLLGLWERDLFVYGRRVSRTLKGGVGDPVPFDLATLVVLTADELREHGGFAEGQSGES